MIPIQLPELPEQRLALALAFSVLLHILVLWLPHITLPRNRVPLPLLTVRFEPSPVQRQQPAQQHAPQMPAALQTPPARNEPAPPVAAKPGTAQARLAAQIPRKEFEARQIEIPAAALADQSLPLMASTPYDKTRTPTLPLHAQLRFAVYLGDSDIPIGDMFQELDINGNQYTLQSQLVKAGMGSLVSRYEIKQGSHGTLTDTGILAPDAYSEESTGPDGTHRSISVAFHWADQQLVLANGTSTTLPAGTQDMLSFLYQFSNFSFHPEIIPLSLADGYKLESMRFEIGMQEEIDTPMGKILAMHLSEMHDQGEPWMEIWLGLNYRLLPVRFRKIEANGRVSEEMDIREIRSSDNP